MTVAKCDETGNKIQNLAFSNLRCDVVKHHLVKCGFVKCGVLCHVVKCDVLGGWSTQFYPIMPMPILRFECGIGINWHKLAHFL